MKSKVDSIDVLKAKQLQVCETRNISLQDAKKLEQVAYSSYHEIAGDLEPDNPARHTCNRDTILDVVLDHFRYQINDSNLLEIVSTLNANELRDVFGPAFHYNEYEVGNF